MIEKQQYELYDVNEGIDDTVYDMNGFDPEIMLPEEDVYKPKKKLIDRFTRLSRTIYMEEKLDEDN